MADDDFKRRSVAFTLVQPNHPFNLRDRCVRMQPNTRLALRPMPNRTLTDAASRLRTRCRIFWNQTTKQRWHTRGSEHNHQNHTVQIRTSDTGLGSEALGRRLLSTSESSSLCTGCPFAHSLYLHNDQNQTVMIISLCSLHQNPSTHPPSALSWPVDTPLSRLHQNIASFPVASKLCTQEPVMQAIGLCEQQ